MTKRNSTSFRRTTKSTPVSTPPRPTDQEEPWQWMMVFNYVIHEAVDAMQRESASGQRHQPLNQSWQQFVQQLRLQKPALGYSPDKLLKDGFLQHPLTSNGGNHQ